MKIALLGYGKMGRTIEQLAIQQGHQIVYKSTGNAKEGDLFLADVAIEFSIPEAAVHNMTICFEHNIPVVCGTTGWLDRWNDVVNICESSNGCLIYASNYSVGVNLFFNLNTYLAKLMQPYKAYIPSMEEIHHTEKKDAPSGTAITLAEGILAYSDRSGWELDAMDPDKLSIKAIREGDVKGTHIVRYSSPIDSISIKHEAFSREGFALGALLAAEWLLGKKGVFSMKDVLNLK
jgi:4-hydroxy-tetrahydrodipicolinate reductase